jgi:putative selenium metabolism hydrolase
MTIRASPSGAHSSSLDDCVALVQRLLRTASLPGHEGDLARLVSATMQELRYDSVTIDEVGNVIGCIRGRGDAPGLMLNTHLDHVDAGDPAAWRHPPFAAEWVGTAIHGRGAVDIKGPLACQLIAGARLLNERPPGNVWVTCVVQEEIGGVGARYLARSLPCRLVVVGEPSSNRLRRGQRGRIELALRIQGRSVHASVPHHGINPLLTLGRFLTELETLEHRVDPDLGASTVAPTLVRTDQASANVIPGVVHQVLDWRNVPGQTDGEVQRAILEVAQRVALAGTVVEVSIPSHPYGTWTGVRGELPANNPPFSLPNEHPAIRAAAKIVADVAWPGGSNEDAGPVGCWHFATDGGHFAAAGATVIGFGPGDELLAHTVDEHITVDALDVALAVYERLARELPSALASHSRGGP